MGSESYYAVMIGRKPGVFKSWPECQAQVKGFRNAQYKKFPTMEEAQAFVNLGRPTAKFHQPKPKPEPKFQATRVNVFHQNNRETPFTSNEPTPTTRILPKRSRKPSINAHGERPSKLQNTGLDRKPTYTKKEPTPTTTRILPKRNHEPSSNAHGERPSKLQNTGLDRKPTYTKKPPYAVVYTDGASSNNGKHHARAGYGVYWGDNDPRNVSARLKGKRQTNQRAEATAVLHVLKDTQGSNRPLEIRTDSQYVINAATVWSKNWVKRSWIATNGKEVQNRDLFEPIVNLMKNRRGAVKFTYVPGHSGFEGNEKADQLAVAGARLED